MLSDLEVQRREAAGRKKYLDHLQVVHSQEQLTSTDTGDKEDLADALARCIEALSAKSRKLLLSRFGSPRSVAEIAQSEGMKEPAVRVALFRIRQALRKCVESATSAATAASATPVNPVQA